MIKWFLRNGYELSDSDAARVTPKKNGESGSFQEYYPCMRCGGHGGADAWKFTGYTCYRCGASTQRMNGLFLDPSCPRTVAVYTQEKLDKLNAAAERKLQRKQEKFELEKILFMNEYGSIVEAAEYYAQKNNFVASVLDTVKQTLKMSEKQEESLIKAFATTQGWINKENQKKEGWVGQPGDKLVKTLTLRHEVQYPGYYYNSSYYISIYEDEEGYTYVYKGSSPKGRKGEATEMKFTVKEHSEYNGKKNTIISRVKEV